MKKLNRDFYLGDAIDIAPRLLGKRLVHKTDEGVTAGVIVEAEVYSGIGDKGSHSCSGIKTKRTEIQFAEGGRAYVYMLYGMYYCFNVVCGPENSPQVVLIRALRPDEGTDIMKARRKTDRLENLCSGPGKLCAALDITKAQYGLDLCGSELYLTEGEDIPEEKIMTSPRVNIDYAEEYADYPWRFYLKDDPFVSKVPKRYIEAAKPFLVVGR